LKNKLIDIGLLLIPSVRALAYLGIFKSLQIFPKEIILMQGKISNLKDLRNEDEKFRYSQSFFDINLDINELIENSGPSVIKVATKDVNDINIHSALTNFSSKYFIFTTGGILSKQTLSLNKKFIHIHPGILPAYRGSTCFYFSILSDHTLGSTAFIMDEEIDKGNLIASSRFNINYKIYSEQKLFMDYVLDPFIRSITLKKVLQIYLDSHTFSIDHQNKNISNAYYIMHPLLRYLTIKKINKYFDKNKLIGIFETEENIT